jgi:cAMP-dependent protein kinase regulator
VEKMREYESGGVFGELALLYNAPRAATITAETESVLFALDRGTFNHIVRDSAIRKKEQYEKFLRTVPILKDMSTQDIS